jgi:hypothetical protein
LLSTAYTGPDNYTNAQGVNFTFNNIPTNQSAAQALCNRQCGYLASYISAQEQNDVEQFFIGNVRSFGRCDEAACQPRTRFAAPVAQTQLLLQPSLRLHCLSQGLLIPKFHQNYWMGLLPNTSINTTPQPWYWIDQYNPAPGDNGTYSAWGVLQDPPANIPEPNNYLGDENCSVGNWSEAAGTPPNWGWADVQCNGTFVNICRMQSEWRASTTLLRLLNARPADCCVCGGCIG